MRPAIINISEIIECKRAGLTAKEAADKTGINISSVQKIYARAKDVNPIADTPSIRVQKAIHILQKYPLLKISQSFDLTKSELVMLYRSEEWETTIKPARIAHRLKNDPYAEIDAILERCSIDTVEALERMPDWAEIVDGRKQYKEARVQYEALKEERKQLRKEVSMCIPRYEFADMTIPDLNGKVSDIPEFYRHEITGRFSNKIANTVLDLEYIQLKQEIHLLENKIDAIIHEKFKAIVAPLNSVAEDLLIRHIGGVRIKKEPIPITKKIKGTGMDMGKFLELMDEERWQKYYIVYNDEIWDREMFEKRLHSRAHRAIF